MLFSDKKVEVLPLVAGPSVARPLYPFGFSSMHRTSDWYQKLFSCFDSIYRMGEDELGDEESRIQQVTAILESDRDIINVPLVSGLRMLKFLPLYSAERPYLNDLHLSMFLIALRMFADVNCDLTQGCSSDTVLNGFFEKGVFDIDVLNLLFSYGLTDERFCFAFQAHIAKQVGQHHAVALQELLACLNNEVTREQKNAFAIEYNVCRKSLDVQKGNDYSSCYHDLRDAFEAYKKGQYSDAADFYKSASLRLEKFQCKKTLNRIILEDYKLRYEKSLAYSRVCSDLANAALRGSKGIVFNSVFSSLGFFRSHDASDLSASHLALRKYKNE